MPSDHKDNDDEQHIFKFEESRGEERKIQCGLSGSKE